MPRRPAPNPAEARRRKAQKRLEALDYTPQAAKGLSGMLCAMRADVSPCAPISSGLREARLRAFSEIVKGK